MSLRALLPLLAVAWPAPAQTGYETAPKEVRDILYAPMGPTALFSPARDRALLVENDRYPPLADLARPYLSLAGRRIDPLTHGPNQEPRLRSLTVLDLQTGDTKSVALPKDGRPARVVWSPDGGRFAFSSTVSDGVELWVGTPDGQTRRVDGVRLNAAYGTAFVWMPDSKTLLCQLVVNGKPPAAPAVPAGPTVQDSGGKTSRLRTYQNLLRNRHDEDLFAHYATSQLALVGAAGGSVVKVGAPALFQRAEPSPDGKYFLVTQTRRPFSYLVSAERFPRRVGVWDRAGREVLRVADHGLTEPETPDRPPPGKRDVDWRPGRPASLIWAEPVEEKDPKRGSTRDRLLQLDAPFTGAQTELARTERRYAGIFWGEDGLALIRDADQRRRSRTFAVRVDDPAAKPRLLWERSAQDRYGDPGQPLTRPVPGGRVLIRDGEHLFLAGQGASPEGDRPFLDRFHLETKKSERLFQCPEGSFESVAGLVAADGSRFLTRHETATTPPNLYLRSADGKVRKALTSFADATPQLRKIKKQLVTYKRADGVRLSFTLYLPPDYKEGTRLPAVLWAYPREFDDTDAAGQVTGSPHRFTTLVGPSHLFFLLHGYAVLDGASMPVVGEPRKANDTFVEQVVSSAKAAIDKADEMGVIDRDRVGVGGHSYGAFMTANLLAHSDLFRAGIARSGAYNRTLTPFGFQTERRTLWEAPELYVKVSPLLHAHKINEPLLLVHGEQDSNTGTFPMQSERLFQAVRGNGGTVRYVSLPHESHGYAARESVEHVLHEMLAWFDKHVKNAPPRKKV